MSLLERLANSSSIPTVEGEWMTIQWTPDLTTREKFNLGVVLKAKNEIFLRTIDGDNFDRFTCMFDEEMKHHAERITKLSEMLVHEGCIELSEQLKFDNHGFIRGKSASKLIDHLFEIAVPLGRQRQNRRRANSGFHSLNLQQLSNGVIDELKRQDEFGMVFDDIIPHSRFVEINRQRLHVPLRPKNKRIVGNWASVVFADPKRIKSDYLQAINDLRTASDELKRKPALFILKPNEDNIKHLKKSRIEQIDEVVDYLDSTLKPQGIELYSATSISGLVEDIYQWNNFAA